MRERSTGENLSPMDVSAFPPLRFEFDRGRCALMLLGCLSLLAASVWMILDPDAFRGGGVFVQALGVLGLLAAGLSAALCARCLVTRGPAVDLSADALTLRTGNAHARISWNDITGILLLKEASSRSILIEVADPNAIVRDQPRVLFRFLANRHRKKYGTPLHIPLNEVLVTEDDLIREIQVRVEAAGRRTLRPEPSADAPFVDPDEAQRQHARRVGPIRRS